MKTQSDSKVRVVALSNLEAMCEYVSGTCHTYEISKVSRSRIHVTYSNPNEYGYSNPMTAVFPCYPNGFEQYNPMVVLEYLNIIHDSWHGEGWQAFETLRDCPQLWRNPNTNQWQTEADITPCH